MPSTPHDTQARYTCQSGTDPLTPRAQLEMPFPQRSTARSKRFARLRSSRRPLLRLLGGRDGGAESSPRHL
jgi:hypothetical protein